MSQCCNLQCISTSYYISWCCFQGNELSSFKSTSDNILKVKSDTGLSWYLVLFYSRLCLFSLTIIKWTEIKVFLYGIKCACIKDPGADFAPSYKGTFAALLSMNMVQRRAKERWRSGEQLTEVVKWHKLSLFSSRSLRLKHGCPVVLHFSGWMDENRELWRHFYTADDLHAELNIYFIFIVTFSLCPSPLKGRSHRTQ